MPLLVVSLAEATAGFEALEPDLAYLLADRGVSAQIQSILGHLGITRLNVFAKIERADDQVRAWLRADVGLDGAEVPRQQVEVAKVLDAWEASRDRILKQT